MGPILVSEREDGSLWIFDGQHRVEALKILGELVWEVTIYSGMTLKDEATAFDYYKKVLKRMQLNVM